MYRPNWTEKDMYWNIEYRQMERYGKICGQMERYVLEYWTEKDMYWNVGRTETETAKEKETETAKDMWNVYEETPIADQKDPH